MRTKYSAPYSYPDFSISVPERLGTDYGKTAIALTLRQLGFVPLTEKYQAKAKDVSDAHGCANCRGIEVLKSCIAASAALAIDGLDGLIKRYCPSLCGRGFGECSNELYRSGLIFPDKDGEDRPLNPLLQPWYEALLTQKAALSGDNLYTAVTKKSSNAHSVLSRKTLEIGFRYGLSEYLAVVLSPGLRDLGNVIPQSLELAGCKNSDASDIMARWSVLGAEFKNAFDDQGMLTGIQWVELTRRIMDNLTSDLSGIVHDDRRRRQWPHKVAALAGTCTLYRYLILSLSSRQRKFAPDLREFVSDLVRVLSCANAEQNIYLGTFDITNITTELGRNQTSSNSAIAQQIIDNIGLNWQNEKSVEFGHQCGLCEDAQGDDDLSRRLIDYVADHDGAIAPNPSFGASFADLSVSSEGDTVWDLSNSVTCQAIEVFYTSMCVTRNRTQTGPAQDFLTSLTYHCNQNAVLFIAYLEILMLELSYSTKDGRKRRIVKLIKDK